MKGDHGRNIEDGGGLNDENVGLKRFMQIVRGSVRN